MALSPELMVAPSEKMRRSVEGLLGEQTVELE